MYRRLAGVAALLTALAVLLTGCVGGHWRTYSAAQRSLQEAAPAEWAAYESAQSELTWRSSRFYHTNGWRPYRRAREFYLERKAEYDAEVTKLVGDAQMAEQAALDAAVGAVAELYHAAADRYSKAAKALIHEAQDLVDEAEKARRKYEAAIEALKQAAPAEWAAFEAAADTTDAAANGRYEEERARGKKDAKIAENAYEARLLLSPDGSFPLVP